MCQANKYCSLSGSANDNRRTMISNLTEQRLMTPVVRKIDQDPVCMCQEIRPIQLVAPLIWRQPRSVDATHR